jgi:acyl CoA:acetate/3-ketoacid CoA transferase alpha subunit
MRNKVMSLTEAIEKYVQDGDTLVIEGFTHLI